MQLGGIRLSPARVPCFSVFRIVDLERIIIKERERYKIVPFVPNLSSIDKQSSKDGLAGKEINTL